MNRGLSKTAAIVVMTVVLGGCAASNPDTVCTADKSPSLMFDIAPDVADRVTDISIRLCRAGSCEEPSVTLLPAREGSGRVGRVLDSALTAEPVETTVQVSTSTAGDPVASRLTITPRTIRRGGNCGVDYTAQLRVAGDGSVTQS